MTFITRNFFSRFPFLYRTTGMRSSSHTDIDSYITV